MKKILLAMSAMGLVLGLSPAQAKADVHTVVHINPLSWFFGRAPRVVYQSVRHHRRRQPVNVIHHYPDRKKRLTRVHYYRPEQKRQGRIIDRRNPSRKAKRISRGSKSRKQDRKNRGKKYSNYRSW